MGTRKIRALSVLLLLIVYSLTLFILFPETEEVEREPVPAEIEEAVVDDACFSPA